MLRSFEENGGPCSSIIGGRSGVAGRIAIAAILLTGSPVRAEELQAAAASPPAIAISTANASLNITPKRLTFSRGERTAAVYIFNRGTSAATFDISLVERVMLPDGSIRGASEAGSDPTLRGPVERLRSAKGMVVATPRRATLAPGAGQTIRVRVSPPVDAASAEYRSHLTVATVPPRDAGVTAEDAASGRGDQLTFRITTIYGLSIPVIIRTGAVDARGEIRNVRLAEAMLSPDGLAPPKATLVVKFDLARTGSSSLFGNVEVRGRGRQPLATARGFGVYTEVESRSIQIPLQRRPARGETLEILFLDDDAAPGRTIARASIGAP